MTNQNKKVVIYKTKYGSAKQYAEWIAEELKCEIYRQENFSAASLDKYDTIIYGGSLYAVGILGISLIKNNYEKLKDKKVIIFSVGISPSNEKTGNDVITNNFTEEMKNKVDYHHLRGAFNYNKLSFLHKIMMWTMKKIIERKKPENRTEDDKGLLTALSSPCDFKSKKNILPIIESVEK